jgi:hypothetical protein
MLQPSCGNRKTHQETTAVESQKLTTTYCAMQNNRKRPVRGIFPSGGASGENTSNLLLEVGHGGYRVRAV